jgi:DNA-binding NarL/FixJ family response regulator
MLTVILAEDSVLLREGLVGLLQRFGHTVTAAVGDTTALLDAVRREVPDLVITDVRMPPGSTDDGLRAALTLREEHPDLPVLVLSQYVVQSYAAELLSSGRQGAVGYLLKDRIGDITDFAAAISEVAGGGTVVDPDVVRQLLARRRDPLQRLTPRERDVLALMAEGRSNAAIAATLVVSDAAVAKHVGSIFTKLDLPVADTDHRRVLAVLAYLRGA